MSENKKPKKVPRSFSFDQDILEKFLNDCEREFKNPSKVINRLLQEYVNS